jgi:sugar phosphate isomerase/epimerase
MQTSRRKFLLQTGQLAVGYSLFSLAACGGGKKGEAAEEEAEAVSDSAELFFKISLAQWSLHRTIRDQKALDNLDFAAKARNDFGIEAVEYVNQFFVDKAADMTYLGEMNKRAADHGVRNLLIMVDGEGGLGNPNGAERQIAVENHFKWVEAAKFLGCHSIRVNAYGQGSSEDVAKAAVDGLGRLSEYAAKENINVIVENHGGYSSDGKWLTGVISEVNLPNCGTLPDFGNFCIKRDGDNLYEGNCIEEYDRYLGVQEMMPFAKAVSAKSHDFNEAGDETHTDYLKMMKIVKEAGYTGYVGIEYEGNVMSEDDGIRATKALLEKVGRMVG